MSLAPGDAQPAEREAFSGRTIFALVLVGVVALAGFAVLATYAPELRGRSNGGANALSSSAVGYRGAQIMLRALDTPARVSRTRPTPRLLSAAGLVMTPGPGTTAAELGGFPGPLRTLIVLPKWRTAPDPVRPGFVRKVGLLPDMSWAGRMLSSVAPGSAVAVEPGLSRPVLRGAGSPFAPGTYLPVGRMDGLQTISGPGWRPALVDARGRAVLAISKAHPDVFILADPDLLNNQGLSDIAKARVSMAVLQMLSGENGVVFDVTLNGLGRGRSLARLMLEPPWLAATLCLLGAALLMGWQALASFGAPAHEGRAVALGAAALVDNSAGLIRMARKEAAFAPDYAQTTRELVLKSVGVAPGGADDDDWLARTAERRGLADPQILSSEAARVKTRDELMAIAHELYRWRLEMTRERG